MSPSTINAIATLMRADGADDATIKATIDFATNGRQSRSLRYTYKEAAKIMRISIRQLRRLVKAGKINVITEGYRTKFIHADELIQRKI